ncbi:MAG: histidinol-phosphate transaminase [Saprospiraceae bacterium]
MNVENLVRPNIRQLSPYSSARSEFKGQAEVFIDANENPFETGLNRYPDPLQWQLKEAISHIWEIPKEHIFLGNGSDEVIDLLVRIFCEPRIDHIITLPPTYGMYKVSASIEDIAIKEILLTPDYQPRLEPILSATTPQSKILFLCSPNNPTGNDLEPELVFRLLDQFPGIVVIDEAYIDFSSQESFRRYLKTYPNLVVTQTFSKAWGLAGIRLGMAFASEAIIAYLNKVKPPYNVNQLTQKAALEALQNQQQQAEWVDTILKERDLLADRLKAFAFVKKIHPSAANFLLVEVEQPKDLYQFLVEHGIIARDRSSVPLCEGCLRLTVGRPEENQLLLSVLQAYQA